MAQTIPPCERLINGTVADPIRQVKVTDAATDIAGFDGHLELKPAGYDDPANATKNYPVLIYFHGLGGRGTGTPAQLCQIIVDAEHPDGYSLPLIIERGRRNAPVVPYPDVVQNTAGAQFSYLVISPQYLSYNYPTNYPSANDVALFIEYVKDKYRIDTSRIYLTGLSSGANMVMEYVGSSLARAKSVAAVSVASLCSKINSNPANGPVQNVGAGQNIGQAKLPTYFIHCSTDGANCPIATPQQWVNEINAVPESVAPVFETVCSPANDNNHNTWYLMYDPAHQFTDPRINEPTNIYEWMINQVNLNVLPVTLSDYSVRLTNGKVQVRWSTTSETNNKSFTIERAGADQRFTSIGTVNGAGNSSIETKYEFTDNMPLQNISYYRLTQTDIDGKREVFDIKQVLNNAGNKSKAIISPNPFGNSLAVFVSLQKTQKVSVYLTDMSGRRVATQTGVYSEGSAINVNTAALRPGVYFVKVESEGIAETHRVIKQ